MDYPDLPSTALNPVSGLLNFFPCPWDEGKGEAALAPRLVLWECKGLIPTFCLIISQTCKPLPRGNTIAAVDVKYSSLGFFIFGKEKAQLLA